ncbi:MAG: glycosyltransferase [Thermodesulfobacteriota bacterium]|nr:glycosyltransferase [Thermodesulfobacteriota bacterium]
MLPNRPQLGIVVPCWNEEDRLPVMDFIEFCEKSSGVAFVFVNDGSLDNTRRVLGDLAKRLPNQVTVVNLPSNRGKGEAIRAGIMELLSWQCCASVGYWDADLSTPLDEILRFLEVLEQLPCVQFVCGSRIRKMGSLIERLWHRHYLGRCFATGASLVLRLPIYDTQCGAKIIKADLAARIFDKPFISKWFFDVELLARTVDILGHERTMTAVFELPLNSWRDTGGSKRRMRHYFIAAYDLLRIRLKFKL